MSQWSEVFVIEKTNREILYGVLVHPRLPLVTAGIGMLLCLPTLSAGWMADDYWHRFILLHPPAPPWLHEIITARHPLDLFRFFDGDAARTRRVIDLGFVPWWTSSDAHGAFFRPLSSLTHWLDHGLWPFSSWPMHAHSIVWYGMLVVSVTALYRKVMGACMAAGLASILYAIDDAHGVPVAFLANRNALITGFFGVLAVYAHIQHTTVGRRAWGIHSTAWFSVSLLAGEAGVAALAYIAAYAVCIDRRSWTLRITGLVPYLVVVVLWRVYWNLDGYGVANISVYIDPLHDPGLFLREASHRIPTLLFGQWSGLPPDIALLLGDRGVWRLKIVAVAFFLSMIAFLWPCLRRDETARFWGLGMVLSCIPVSATFPSDRLMLFIGIGSFGLMACVFSAAVRRLRSNDIRRWSRWSIRTAIVAMLVPHLALAPIAFPLRVSHWFGPAALLGRFQVHTPLDASVENQTLVVVNTPMALMVGHLPLSNAIERKPIPRRMRLLSPSAANITLRRIDEHTLIVRPDPPVLSQPFDRLFRAPTALLGLDDRFEFDDVIVTVTEVDNRGYATEVQFEFTTMLEDSSLRWIAWNGREYVDVNPPGVGQDEFISMKLFSP